MKKLACLLILSFLALNLFAGCGQKETATAETAVEESTSADAPSSESSSAKPAEESMPQETISQEIPSEGIPFEPNFSMENATEESALPSPAIERPTSDSTDSTDNTDNTVDLDLTQLSSILVYSEVFSMMERPEEYMDKTMKMAGLYYCIYDETTEIAYHFIIIEDALECCQQGIEFVWKGDHAYPQDYPEEGTTIEVTGSLETYEESDIEYFRLGVDGLAVL